jgi:dienelactone hydrolase
MTTRIFFFILLATLLATLSVQAQQPSRSTQDERLEKEGCVANEQSKVKICKYDYLADGNKIEAFTIRPLSEGKYPGLVLLAGREGAKTFFTFGTMLARQGFVSLAISEPGFGKSEGKADFMGPKSIEAFAIGFKKFRQEPFVESERMGVYGYSRGGMAASLLTVKLGKAVKAAVFGAGVYDFKKAYDETKFDGIRDNIKTETEFTEKAIRERSSILQMKKLETPVLIIHGENDENVPTNQAMLLRDCLTELKKDFEILILSDHKHGQLKGNFISPVMDFFCRKLKCVPVNQETAGPLPKKPRSLEDYKLRTLQELAATLPDGPRRRAPDDGLFISGDLVPSRMTVIFIGTSRPIPQIKKDLIVRWARQYAGSPEHYTTNRESELLFTEDGVDYWLSIPKPLLQQLETELKKGDEVDLYLIRPGGIRNEDKWEPVLLVEKFAKPK